MYKSNIIIIIIILQNKRTEINTIKIEMKQGFEAHMTYCDKGLLQIAMGCVLQNATILLQIMIVITKCDILRQHTYCVCEYASTTYKLFFRTCLFH